MNMGRENVGGRNHAHWVSPGLVRTGSCGICSSGSVGARAVERG
jgi:hypothetical protein